MTERMIRENGMVCLTNPQAGGEFGFCGYAMDAGVDEPGLNVIDTSPSGVITCPDCISAIAEIRKAIRNVKTAGEG